MCIRDRENCPYTHCPKGLMTKDIVERTGSPNLKMLWDPANSYRADRHRVPPEFLGSSLREELLECLPYIGYVHVKDYHYDPEAEGKKFRHEALGKGDIDFREIAEILREKKDGCMLSIEPEVMTREEILESLRYYREAVSYTHLDVYKRQMWKWMM